MPTDCSSLQNFYVTALVLCSVTIAIAIAKSLQSCPTLCDPIDGSPPGSSIPGILQARTLEWVAISFSNAWKWKVKVKSLSRVWPSATPWTAAYQAPPSMGFSRQEYWSGVPLPYNHHSLMIPITISINTIWYKTIHTFDIINSFSFKNFQIIPISGQQKGIQRMYAGPYNISLFI